MKDFRILTLRLSNVISLPYSKISQSGVLFSAIENDIPMIVSDVGGLSEPLSIGNIGWILDEPTANNLYKEIHSIEQKPKIIKDKSDLIEFS